MSSIGGPSESSRTPGERLVRRTGFGLAVFTLALIAILLFVVGVVTAAAVTQTTDQSVDSNLHTAAENMLTALAPTPSPTPPTTPMPQTPSPPTAGPTDDAGATPDTGSGGDESGDGENDGAGPRASLSPAPTPALTPVSTPSPTSVPTSSTTPKPTSPSPTPAASAAPVLAAAPGPPEASDTFFLVLDPSGNVVANPQNVFMTGLPNADAAAVAAGGSEDWRTVEAEGTHVRLLSEPMYALDGSISGVLQTGFVLTAHEEQQALIVRTIIIASLLGLLGAAIVTLFVTRRAMAPIRAAFEAERRFVASASHELKTPVAIVRSSAEILQREDLVEPEGRYLVEDVIAESDRLGRLVGDLLALASAEAGQISLHTTTFDLRALVDEVVGRVRAVAAERGVRIEAVADRRAGGWNDELLVVADRERMIQLLSIFIDNAIDHSPQDGLVRVTARPVDDGSRSGRRVVVEVIDQGPGVPLAERDRIFEPFARVAGRRRTTGTTGLGLAIARILAARQDATLAVSDAPGGGASFSVSLARRLPGPQNP